MEKVAPKKRRLDYNKCERCREDKKKCTPSDRHWPGQRCQRCIDKELPCSAPGRASSGGSTESVISADASRPEETPSTPPPTSKIDWCCRIKSHLLLSRWLQHILKCVKTLEAIETKNKELAPSSAKFSQPLKIAERIHFARNAQKAMLERMEELSTDLIAANRPSEALLVSQILYDEASCLVRPSTEQEHFCVVRHAERLFQLGDIGAAEALQTAHVVSIARQPEDTTNMFLDEQVRKLLRFHQEFSLRLQACWHLLNNLDPSLLAPLPLLHRRQILRVSPCVSLLIACKTQRPDTRDYLDQTPLHVAAEIDAMDSAIDLIRWGVPVNAEDIAGRTALHTACENGFARFAALLVMNGANLHAQTHFGATPLHWAVWKEHEAVVRELLSTPEANIDAKDKWGQTPFMLSWKATSLVVRDLVSDFKERKSNLGGLVQHDRRLNAGDKISYYPERYFV